MKKIYFSVAFLFSALIMLNGQNTDALVASCVMNVGPNAKYLKDYRIQLGKGSKDSEPRYKANISLWKNTKYRFSMCNAQDSNGELFLSIKDDKNKTVITSYDKTTGKAYPFIDFVCSKSGVYQLNYDFTKGEQGSGVGVVSMVR